MVLFGGESQSTNQTVVISAYRPISVTIYEGYVGGFKRPETSEGLKRILEVFWDFSARRYYYSDSGNKNGTKDVASKAGFLERLLERNDRFFGNGLIRHGYDRLNGYYRAPEIIQAEAFFNSVEKDITTPILDGGNFEDVKISLRLPEYGVDKPVELRLSIQKYAQKGQMGFAVVDGRVQDFKPRNRYVEVVYIAQGQITEEEYHRITAAIESMRQPATNH